jgi:hypothetical protein
MKANKRDKGMINETINVVLQSAIKRRTMKVTNRIPSRRFPRTVSMA